MKNSIIIVPYRNRPEHLTAFIAHMHTSAYSSMEICIVEQEEGKPFNRAKLLNIGFLQNDKYTHFIFHDVDMLPVNVNYTIKPSVPIMQLAGSDIQLLDYLGGVTRFSKAAFIKSGGYNNEYYHRAEDNEMMFNLKRLGMNVIRKPGKYTYLQHERKGPEFDPGLWDKAKKQRAIQNQLPMCNYTVVSQQTFGFNVRHLIVKC